MSEVALQCAFCVAGICAHEACQHPLTSCPMVTIYKSTALCRDCMRLLYQTL